MNDSEAIENLHTGKMLKGPNGLFELSFKTIPKIICQSIESLLNIGTIYAMGFVYRGDLFATAIIITRRGVNEKHVVENSQLIEIFINQAAIALQRNIFLTALRDSEKKYRLLFENATDAIFITQGGTIKFPNPKALELIGYTQEEISKIQYKDLIHPEDRELEYLRYNKWVSRQENSPLTLLYRIINKSGDEIVVSTNVVNVEWEGKSAHLYFVRDITTQKKLEARIQQINKMESIGILAGGIAHEFNNMLGVITGHTELAMDFVNNDSPISHHLNEIQKAALRSAELTSQLLGFARKQMASPKIIALNDIIYALLNMIKRIIDENIALNWVPHPELWPIKIDPAQVDQILANLCLNARDAINGAGEVTIKTQNTILDKAFREEHPECIPGDYVMLSISDTGRGMDEETLRNLFVPFFTTKEVGAGTGLGLATVYGIVKQNDGYIYVHSIPGRGTTIDIYFPRILETKKAKEKSGDGEIAGGAETVLLVEDEESILDLGKVVLEKFGYTVLSAGTPGEALSMAENHQGPIDLLVTDVVMPEMNGRDLKFKIEKIKPDIKALYISGYTFDIIIHRGILENDVHFLQKPFSFNTLAKKVREILDEEKG